MGEVGAAAGVGGREELEGGMEDGGGGGGRVDEDCVALVRGEEVWVGRDLEGLLCAGCGLVAAAEGEGW